MMATVKYNDRSGSRLQQQAMDLLSRNTVVCRTVDGGGVQGKNTIMIAGRGVERVVVSYPSAQTDSRRRRRRGTKCCSLWS